MSFKEIIEQWKRGPSDLVALDITDTDVAAVRLKRGNDGVTLLAADFLPAVEMPDDNSSEPSQIEVAGPLGARHAAITVEAEDAVVKLLSIPGQFDEEAEEKLMQSLGLEDPESHRIAYKLVAEGHGRGETKLLAVALPEKTAAVAVKTLPVGLPVPYSLEVSGLAVFSAFLHGPCVDHLEEAVAAVDFSGNISSFAIFNKGVLSLIRRFDAGTNTILEKIQDNLGVDRETAQGIMADGAFDISQPVGEVMRPLVKQITVSRDFVERRENCKVSKLYVSGGLAPSRDALGELKSSAGTDVEAWDPFKNLNVSADAVSEKVQGKEWRFAAPVGAALAAFEER